MTDEKLSYGVANTPLPERLFYTVQDPETQFQGRSLPACTTMLHRVCMGDETRFEEACRLISLYINAAYELGKEVNNESS